MRLILLGLPVLCCFLAMSSGCLRAYFAHKGAEHTVFAGLFCDTGNNNTLNVRQLSGVLWLFFGCFADSLR